jgi:hypothetical protein
MNYCRPSETLFGNWQADKDYYVTGSIVSTQNIANGYSVGYHAGSYVELNNGFVSGNNFVAEINPCVISRTTIAAKTDDVEEEIQQSPSSVLVEGVTLKIYPTVVESENAIKIEADRNLQNVFVTIFDIQGKAVEHSNIGELSANQPHSFMLNSLPSGFYFVKTQNSTFSFTQKIIVK